MSYRDFTVKRIQDQFGIEIQEAAGLFGQIAPHPVSERLRETLAENVHLAVSINTEKARSEMIIAPVLLELRRIFDRKISLFSGVEMDVDKEHGLAGFCDFIVSLSAEQLFVKSPVIAIVEARNENLMNGLGQCLAEMVASRIFNEQEDAHIDCIYGVVTSGNVWRFLKLCDNRVSIDLDDYGIKEIDRILGILAAMIEQKA